MALIAQNISVNIGKKAILRDMSVNVTEGRVTAILGANGAGKSTLLKTLAGEIQPTQGDIMLDGQALDLLKGHDVAKQRAVLPQSSQLAFAFTVIEIVLMGRLPHSNGLERPQDYAIAHEVLARVDLLDMADRVYTTLSGGEQQRVQLARILAQIWEAPTQGNRYLLMDEPTNNLDLTHQHLALQIANELAQTGVGVLVILHDLNLAAQYAQHLMILNQGQTLIEGKPHEVLTPNIIQEAFNLPVTIAQHPHLDCPLVIPLPVDITIKPTFAGD